MVQFSGIRSLRIRTGGAYNFSRYMDLDGEGTPGRGLYLGLTFNAARSSVNNISRYYEARAYMRGPIPGRPDDMLSLVAAMNGYSAAARAANATPGFYPYANTQTYTISYDFRVLHGLFMQPGLSAISHPVYDQRIGTTVNGY